MPGWYSTYWVKMLSDIEVIGGSDQDYWMAKAYRIPVTPGASVAPGATGFPTEPINRMAPRSFVTNLRDGQSVKRAPLAVRGIAMGGATGVAKVDLSIDDGATWRTATLGPDMGRYGFRRWEATFPAPDRRTTILARCTNADGEAQPMTAGWNPSGFMRNVVERLTVQAA